MTLKLNLPGFLRPIGNRCYWHVWIVGGQGLLVARKETPEDGGVGGGVWGGSQWKGGRVKRCVG